MFDRELVLDILNQTLEAIDRITQRFEPVESPNFFTDSEIGREKLDAICMLLIAIGESIKNVDRITDKRLLAQYQEIDWKGVKGIRDIISHHYFDIDAEEIFLLCSEKIEPLRDTVQRIISDLQTPD